MFVLNLYAVFVFLISILCCNRVLLGASHLAQLHLHNQKHKNGCRLTVVPKTDEFNGHGYRHPLVWFPGCFSLTDVEDVG